MVNKKTKEAKGERVAERVIGKHVFGNLYGIDPVLLKDRDFLKKTIEEAIVKARMHLVHIRASSFGGQKGGISVIALINESHVVLHTWNKYDYASLDIYTCGETSDPEKAFTYVVSKLKPKRHQRFFADRSSD